MSRWPVQSRSRLLSAIACTEFRSVSCNMRRSDSDWEGHTSHLSRSPLSRIALCLASLAVACSMWFYIDAILVRYQIADSAAHSRPRGNLSDLYPRWLGARELLLHGRNPYGNDITIEIQKGYFGRKLDPSLPNDPKD